MKHFIVPSVVNFMFAVDILGVLACMFSPFWLMISFTNSVLHTGPINSMLCMNDECICASMYVDRVLMSCLYVSFVASFSRLILYRKTGKINVTLTLLNILAQISCLIYIVAGVFNTLDVPNHKTYLSLNFFLCLGLLIVNFIYLIFGGMAAIEEHFYQRFDAMQKQVNRVNGLARLVKKLKK